jgi:hypothetical protein
MACGQSKVVPVSEISQYLPFSQRPPRDESAVTSNWGPATATVLSQLAGLLSGLTAAEWDTPSVRVAPHRNTVTVRTIVGELLWRLQGTRRSRLISVVTTMATQHHLPASAIAHHVQTIAQKEPASLLAELTALATKNHGNTRTIRQLGAGVVALYEISDVTGRSLEHAVDPLTSGAVALAASLGAPLPIRAVLRQCKITARDGNAVPDGDDCWSVGHGRQSNSTASAIVLFLYGRRGFPATIGG